MSATDREVFAVWLEYARTTHDVMAQDRALCQLRDLLGRNQNGKRHGGDGSFTGKQWEACRDALKAMQGMISAQLDMSEGLLTQCATTGCSRFADDQYAGTEYQGFCATCVSVYEDLPF